MAEKQTALVIGSGVIGLQTTLQLLRKNVHVILRSPRHPLNGPTRGSSTAVQSCSMGSGGKWFPTKCDDPRVSKWATETLDFLLDFRASQTNPIVEIVPTINAFHRVPPIKPSYSFDHPPIWTQHPRLRFEQLSLKQLFDRYSNTMWLPEEDKMIQAGYEWAWLYHPPIVDTPAMLQHMLSDITHHPIMKQDCRFYEEWSGEDKYNAPIQPMDLETGKYYKNTKEMIQDVKDHFPHCRWIFNCTGIGHSVDPESFDGKYSKPLEYIDPTMVGGRGVLLYYDRLNLIRQNSSNDCANKVDVSISIEQGPWGSPSKPAYVIPRGNVLVSGGSYHIGDCNPNITEEERKELTINASVLARVDTERTQPWGEWVGFRPVRQDGCARVEVELDGDSNIQMIHNYGHGGSGWTVYIGAVNEAISLMGGNMAE